MGHVNKYLTPSNVKSALQYKWDFPKHKGTYALCIFNNCTQLKHLVVFREFLPKAIRSIIPMLPDSQVTLFSEKLGKFIVV